MVDSVFCMDLGPIIPVKVEKIYEHCSVRKTGLKEPANSTVSKQSKKKKPFKNIVEKGENAGNHHFLLISLHSYLNISIKTLFTISEIKMPNLKLFQNETLKNVLTDSLTMVKCPYTLGPHRIWELQNNWCAKWQNSTML